MLGSQKSQQLGLGDGPRAGVRLPVHPKVTTPGRR
jgi:hypothetical protein